MGELNRDLLVAVLALLADAKSRPGLAATLNAWSHDRRQPLAQLLEQAAALDDEHLQALASLAAAHLQTQPDDAIKGRDPLHAGQATKDAPTEIGDDDLGILLNLAPGSESTLPVEEGPRGVLGSGAASEALLGAKGDRFKLIRPHASGGIGQVWVARDSELHRDVALKEIQPQYAEREDQRARFLLEAEITGNLEHPGIVPVYSLGRNADGRPYYAMRFIRGESFLVAIRRFHERFREEAGKAATKSPSVSKWGMEFRQLIGRFLDVCDAMDYAHSRGVLHRDLKPANIMLGDYGETLVVDWGLAKVIGRNDVIPPPPQADADPDPAGESDTSPAETQPGTTGTQQGTTIGTPAYMSPEQARGSIDQLGPPSDVYSLGASLYELLTGQVAFLEKKISTALQKVLAGDFPLPRALDRSIPAPLEGICLKAMATDPAGRYPSVRALAQDLEHWLADEPVTAYAERRLERLGRWFRQHRTWTYAAAAALVAISMVASVAVVVIEGARRNQAAARQEAETNFHIAQDAVEDYLTNVSENTLLKEQDTVDLRNLRQDLLNSALVYYKRFAAERRDDPLRRNQLAKAYFRVGQITKEIDSHQQAIDAFRSAKSIWEALLKADPKRHELDGYLAECDLAIGRLQREANQFEAALNSLTHARGALERLRGDNPAEASYQSNLADCDRELAIIHASLGHSDQGMDLLEQARKIRQRLIEQYPDNRDYQKSLAMIINAVGYAHFQQNDNVAALKSFQEVQDFCLNISKNVTLGPKPIWLLDLLAMSQYNIGSIHRTSGELGKALQSFEQSLVYRSALADLHPSVAQFQVNLGMSYRELAVVQHQAHEDEKAFHSIRRSIDVFDGLVRAQPEHASYHSELGLSLNYLGVLYDNGGKIAEAIRPLQRAVSEQQTAVDKSKDADDYKEFLFNHLDNLGMQYVGQGRISDAVAQYNRALRIRRQLSAAHPKKREYTLEVARALIALGKLRRHDGEPVAAGQWFSEAQTALKSGLRLEPDDPALQGQLAVALHHEASALIDQARPTEARPLLEHAVDLFRQGAGRELPEADAVLHREARSEALWDLARLLRGLKLPADAERADAEREELWKARPPAELVTLALKQASRALLIGHGKTPVSDRAKAVRELDLNQGAEGLKLAIRWGFKDLRMVRSDPDSAILLARDDLRPLIDGLEAAGKPPVPEGLK